MQPESVHLIVRNAEQNFLRGTTKMGRYVSWSMHDTIETIDAYLNSKHISGPVDSLGREKPFFNIVIAIVNVWYRATNIDRKNIRFTPSSPSAVILAFVANILLQQWMDQQNFGKFLKDWGRSLARYGSSVPKFVEKGKDLVATIVPWNRLIPDTIDFDSISRIEKFYKTQAQLKNMATKGHPDYAGYDMVAVKNIITNVTQRRTLDRLQQDNQSNFIEVYEVHGYMDSRLITGDDGRNVGPEDIKYTRQMHAIAFFGKEGKDDEWDDFTLFKGIEGQDPYMKTDLIEEDGRTLSIGAVEASFDAQWQTNHTVKNMRDTLDLASKLIFQTADPMFAGRNVLNAIETGDILTHGVNMPLETVNTPAPNIQAMQNYLQQWMEVAQQVTSTPDAMRGNKLPSGISYALGRLQTSQASSLFDVMTENKGLQLEQMIRRFCIPHFKKQLKNKKVIVAHLDDAQIKEIDAYYIPYAAVQQYNKRTTGLMLDYAKHIANGQPANPPAPFDQQAEENNVRQQLAPLGNKRFFKPDELEGMWKDVFADFEWDNLKIEITPENNDKQATLTTLSTVLQSIAGNPAILQDPNAKMLFGKILMETGVVSPLEISSPTPPPQNTPGGGPPAPGGNVPLALGSAAQPARVMATKERAGQLIG